MSFSKAAAAVQQPKPKEGGAEGKARKHKKDKHKKEGKERKHKKHKKEKKGGGGGPLPSALLLPDLILPTLIAV